jgi:hypothetical protein
MSYIVILRCAAHTMQTAVTVVGVSWLGVTTQINRRKQHVWLPNFRAGTQINIKSVILCAMPSLPAVPSGVQCA